MFFSVLAGFGYILLLVHRKSRSFFTLRVHISSRLHIYRMSENENSTPNPFSFRQLRLLRASFIQINILSWNSKRESDTGYEKKHPSCESTTQFSWQKEVEWMANENGGNAFHFRNTDSLLVSLVSWHTHPQSFTTACQNRCRVVLRTNTIGKPQPEAQGRIINFLL